MIGVAICTHNPDERLLARTLAAIASQTVAPTECVIVDNNSNPPVSTFACVETLLRNHEWARIVIEPKLGLTHARIAAIEATSAATLCFADDDTEPANDYLSVAFRILAEHECIGALGPGKVVVDYVDPVPDWFAQRFSHHFQEKDFAGLAYGSVSGTWTDYYPPGSCLLVRREVLMRYRAAIIAGELSAPDRVGARLSSGGDTQIVWEAVKMGLAAGISSELRIKHMIPAKRATLRYMRRLCYGTASSYLPVLVDSFPDERAKLPSPPSDAQIFRATMKIVTRHLVRMRLNLLPVALATYVGSNAGLVRASGSPERKWLTRWIHILGLE